MHILFLSHYFPPEVNAPASRTFEHCRQWVRDGNNVTVITCAPNCPNGVVFEGYANSIRTVEEIQGIRVIRVWTYIAPNKGFGPRIANYISFMISSTFFALVAVRRVDRIVATSPQFFCGWAGVITKWLKRKPLILEIRDIWPESILAVGAMKESPVIRFLEKMELAMYKAADHIVAAGHGYKGNIVKKGVPEEKVSVVLNGVDSEFFSPSRAVSERLLPARKPDDFVCAYIGTVGMAHGLEVVLDAAAKSGPGIAFWIVGDGARRGELEAECRSRNIDNVTFMGRLAKEAMPAILSACDAALVHLRRTGLFATVVPSKIFEFMAMDVPIIMGVRGEARDIVLSAHAGVPMEPDNAESLLQCIDLIRMRGKEEFAGRTYVRKHFSRKRLARDMLSVMEKVGGDMHAFKV